MKSFKHKYIILLIAFIVLPIIGQSQNYRVTDEGDTIYYVKDINQEQFKQLIADWNATDWKMVSSRPVVVDFNATWCRPCVKLSPILQQLANDYRGEVDFYSIDVDDNPDVAAAFQVRSIPFLLFCPLGKEPSSIVGLYPQAELKKVIDNTILY